MNNKVTDYTGKKFSKLTALSYIFRKAPGKSKWLCICDCGNKKEITTGSLLSGDSKSCGCSRPSTILVGGEIYGRLTVINETNKIGNNRAILCSCSCGRQKVILRTNLLQGKSNSCGCLANELTGARFSKGYKDITGRHWNNIINNAKSRDLLFEITIQESYDLFLKQERKCALTGIMLELKDPKNRTASLDRIDSKVGYNIDNIQWIHKSINKMKMELTDSELVKWARLIVDYADKQE